MWDRVIDGMVGRIESLSEECCELEIGCSAQKEIAHARNAEFNGVVSYVLNGQPGLPQQGQPSYYPRGCPFNGEISDGWKKSKIQTFIKAMINPPLPLATYKGANITNYDAYLTMKGDIN